jgi:hypothetical protein
MEVKHKNGVFTVKGKHKTCPDFDAKVKQRVGEVVKYAEDNNLILILNRERR